MSPLRFEKSRLFHVIPWLCAYVVTLIFALTGTGQTIAEAALHSLGASFVLYVLLAPIYYLVAALLTFVISAADPPE